MNPEKVPEPNLDEKFCDRCGKTYCTDCVKFQEVDFEVNEIVNEHHPNPNVIRTKVNRKGDDVCAWCYNQLIDKFENE